MTVLRALRSMIRKVYAFGHTKTGAFHRKAPVFVTVLLFPIYRQYVNEIYHKINF